METLLFKMLYSLQPKKIEIAYQSRLRRISLTLLMQK